LAPKQPVSKNRAEILPYLRGNFRGDCRGDIGGESGTESNRCPERHQQHTPPPSRKRLRGSPWVTARGQKLTVADLGMGVPLPGGQVGWSLPGPLISQKEADRHCGWTKSKVAIKCPLFSIKEISSRKVRPCGCPWAFGPRAFFM
jgi:hypothetical protein